MDYKVDEIVQYIEKDTDRVYILRIAEIHPDIVRCDVLNGVPTKYGRSLIVRVDFSTTMFNEVTPVTEAAQVLYGSK